MRTTRYELNLYAFYDHTGMERHFERMAAKGWMIEKLGVFWRYRRCEPQTLRFCVAYYPEASEYDPITPSEGEQTFWEYCESAGWTKVAHRAQMHIFRNDDPSAVPIETEATVQVETLHRAAKKEYLVALWSLLALAAYYLVRWSIDICSDPLESLSSGIVLLNFVSELALFALCAFELVSYYRWRKRAVCAARELGRFTPTPARRWVNGTALALLVALVTTMLLVSGEDRRIYLASLIGIGAVTALTQGAKEIMRRKNVEAAVAKAVTTGVALVLAVVYAALLVMGAMKGWFTSVPENAEPYEYRYQYNGEIHTYYAYHDVLPLYVEDLTETDYDRYSCERTAQSSPFLARTEYEQETRWGDWDDIPELYYTVYDVKCAPLYNLCLDALLNEYADRKYNAFVYRAVDAAPWGADSAYRLYDAEDDVDFNTWVLCYGQRIVRLSVNEFSLDDADMALVGKRLG